jgi:hypothetical protein
MGCEIHYWSDRCPWKTPYWLLQKRGFPW